MRSAEGASKFEREKWSVEVKLLRYIYASDYAVRFALRFSFLIACLQVRKQTSGLYYKSFTIVIYYCNDSTIIIYDHNDCLQYCKTMILSWEHKL